jgi:hypothetical protein
VTGIGLIPLVAHPERYSCCTPALVSRWKAAGAVMQVDATTALHARTRGERARDLVANGLADILAADNHGDERSVAIAFEALKDQHGFMQGELLVTRNPKAIISDGHVEAGPTARRQGLLARTPAHAVRTRIFVSADRAAQSLRALGALAERCASLAPQIERIARRYSETLRRGGHAVLRRERRQRRGCAAYRRGIRRPPSAETPRPGRARLTTDTSLLTAGRQ